MNGRDEGDADALRRLPLVPQAGRPLPRPGSGLDCETCHRPISWTAVDLEPRRGDRLRADRGARGARLREVPSRRRLPEGRVGLRRLPPDRLREGEEPGPRRRRASRRRARPATASPTPRGTRGPLRPRGDVPARRRARDAAPAPRVTRTASTGGRPATARAATSTHYQKATNPNHMLAGFPTTCETCHKATDPTLHGRPVRPREVASRRAARDAGVHDVPPERRLPGTAATCASCHLADFQKADEPEPRRGGVPDDVRDVPQGRRRRRGRRGSSTTRRSSRSSGSHATQACASCHGNGVFKGTARDCVGCHLPDLPEGDEPESHPGRASRRRARRATRRRTRPGRGDVRPLEVAARRAARDPGVHDVPPERGLPGAADDVRLVPPGRLPEGDEPEPRRRRASRRRARRATSSPTRRGRRGRSTTRRSSRWWGSTRRRRARRATRTASTRGRRGTASGATCATTRRRRTRTTRRRGSRRRARRATRRRTRRGRRGRSTTRRSSRWWGSTRRRRARRATRTGSTRGRRGTASGATWRLPGDEEPEPRGGGVPDDVRDVPQGDGHGVDAGDVQPRDGLPARGGPRDAGVRVVPQERRLPGDAARPASGATWRSTRRRRTRTTRRRGSRRRARRATRRRTRRGTQGTFNHATVFPLVGVHATQACASCHMNGVYAGTPRTCVGCHLAKYQATTNPNHAAAGFPTTCETCHKATDTTWDAGDVQPRDGLPAGGGPRDAGVRVVPQERRLRGDAARRASGATWRSTRRRRTRTTWRRGSRRRARRATRRRTRRGTRGRSTTRRSSRWWGSTRRRRARRAT